MTIRWRAAAPESLRTLVRDVVWPSGVPAPHAALELHEGSWTVTLSTSGSGVRVPISAEPLLMVRALSQLAHDWTALHAPHVDAREARWLLLQAADMKRLAAVCVDIQLEIVHASLPAPA